MNEFVERILDLPWQEPKRSYEVVVIGGGGHGLATAYYLATRHGLTDVAVVEADYIGSGNTGRNTTIIRANYGITESVRFYQRALDLYATLEEETGCWIMHKTKGLLWLAHSEFGLRAERARALLNQALGSQTEMVTPDEARALCPPLDLSGGGRYPVFGGSYHLGGATARHDRVVWAYAQGILRRGGHILQHTPVTGLLRDGDAVTGVQTANGPISARGVVSAVAGWSTQVAAMADVRLPIRTHPLQALVTNPYALGFEPIVASSELLCYVSQTARGHMLMGAEFDAQPSFSRGSSFEFLASVGAKITHLLPFMADLRVLRQWAGICDVTPDYSPIMGETGVPGFLITAGWGTWGFKAIPAGGEAMAELIATGQTPPLIASFGLDRFARDHAMADQGSAGTR